jgi:type II secretory pathway pseudopilin PulG
MDFRFSIFDLRLSGKHSAAGATAPAPIHQSQIANRKSQMTRRAFTITELLIVIGLIVLFITLAVPAFNTLRGSRSVEAAQTVITSMIDRARQEAIRTGEYRGIMIAPSKDDPQRTVAVLVTRRGADFSADGGDPLDRYKPYDPSIEYTPGQRVTFPIRDGRTDAGSRIYTKTFVRTAANPGVSGRAPTRGNPGANAFIGTADLSIPSTLNPNSGPEWRVVSDDELDIVPADRGGAFTLLAPGIGLQVITQSPLRAGANTFDRYLRAGVIMFNPLGKLDVVAYSVPAASSLGTDVLGATTDLIFPNPAYPANTFPADTQLLSQSGVVIYDAINYREQAGDGAKTGDYFYSYRTDGDYAVPAIANVADEVAEETWLTENALPLLINPQTGASTVVQ